MHSTTKGIMMTVKFVPRSLCVLLLVVGQNGGGERLLFAGSTIGGSGGFADPIDGFHATDGGFTTADEWDFVHRSTVHSTFFPVVGNSNGGAVLDVEGSSSTLYLMYDYFNSPFAPPSAGPLNDVTILFNSTETGGSHTSYAIVIGAGPDNFTAFEKPAGVVAPISATGAFDLAQAPWTPLSQTDLATANFHTALGFGPTLNGAASHLIAEFQLSSRSATNPNGLYSPDPQFWSGSAGDPITFASEIFRLNPDGSVLSTIPALGPDGGPVLQSQSVVPEPGSLTLVGIGMAAVAICAFRRRRAKRTD
jgi:hypothetical protein